MHAASDSRQRRAQRSIGDLRYPEAADESGENESARVRRTAFDEGVEERVGTLGVARRSRVSNLELAKLLQTEQLGSCNVGARQADEMECVRDRDATVPARGLERADLSVVHPALHRGLANPQRARKILGAQRFRRVSVDVLHVYFRPAASTVKYF
jgi:hypothetical protein